MKVLYMLKILYNLSLYSKCLKTPSLECSLWFFYIVKTSTSKVKGATRWLIVNTHGCFAPDCYNCWLKHHIESRFLWWTCPGCSLPLTQSPLEIGTSTSSPMTQKEIFTWAQGGKHTAFCMLFIWYIGLKGQTIKLQMFLYSGFLKSV